MTAPIDPNAGVTHLRSTDPHAIAKAKWRAIAAPPRQTGRTLKQEISVCLKPPIRKQPSITRTPQNLIVRRRNTMARATKRPLISTPTKAHEHSSQAH